MSLTIYSHQELELHQHIEQVEISLTALLQWHSSKITEAISDWLPKLARFHDLGKGSVAFQDYIGDPANYRGDPVEKAHTALSLFLTLKLANQEEWSELDGVALAMVVRGHHTALPTLPQRKIGAVSDADRNLNNFAIGKTARVLIKQLASLDFIELERQTELPVSRECNELCDDPKRYILRMKRYLEEKLIPKVHSLSESAAIDYRLKVQLLFSILLEADKALLAVTQPEIYLQRHRPRWEADWVEQLIQDPSIKKRSNPLRTKIRKDVKEAIHAQEDGRIFSLVAPTGCGKTLLAATWALSLQEKIRARGENPPKIIVVLPFLSIIDQTVKEYIKLLSIGGVKHDGSLLLSSHSLAERTYSEGMETKDERFFLDTWRSELIITTYDQFLMSLIDPKARYQMRFHHLSDALIVMDEV
ncbi:MAG: CRISPR-associated endonuclease Cas3'' [Dehalobacterium sp.]|jgi:CRISPR-associated endonuclease/helicase Cas3